MPYKVFLDGVLLPITPSKIKTKINNKNDTIDLINEGEVNIIKSPGLTDIEFECILPQTKYPFAMYLDGKFKSAIYYLNKLEKLKKGKKKFQFIVTRRNPKNKKLFDTNITVTLEDYTIEEDAENGFDVVVSINLKQYRDFKIKTVKVKKSKSKKKKAKKKTTRSSNKTNGNYMVKKGDCLWNIAKKKLGNASRYKEIYKLNKDVIEKTAKKHGRKSSNNGWWIYPGTKLKLPAK